MCALCGVLGGSDHWTDATPRQGVFTAHSTPASRRLERARQVMSANRILRPVGLVLSDWQGVSYQLSSLTGKTIIVETMAHLCTGIEALIGRALDPLDPSYLARLEHRA